MKLKHLLSLLVMFILLAATRTSVIAQNQSPTGPQDVLGTAFTYQGWLNDGGSPANGSYDFQFVLYTASAGGSQVGSLVQKEDVQVASGYFTVQLDFGAGVFGAQARWLEVGVRPGASNGIFTTLSPRQPLTPAPTALYASNAGSLPWSGLTSVPAGFADGIDNDTLAALSCSAGQIPKLGGGGWGCAADDNTIYTYGTGLALNGTTFSLLAAYSLPQGCANGQMPMWSGGAWVCGNGVVTNGSYADPSWITSLSASKITGVLPVAHGGTGSAVQNFVDLSSSQSIGGIKIFTSVPSFSVASGAPFTVSSAVKVTNLNADQVDGYHVGNSSGQIPVSNGTVNASLNADLLDGQPASYFQGRVNGTCAVGSTIQAINADGSVVCQADAPLNRAAVPQANAIVAVDSAGDVGYDTSITIGADGLPVVSYYDNTNHTLKVLHCGDAFCSSANTIVTVDSAGDVGQYTSITIGADGLPVISYLDYTKGDLKVAHCGNAACTSSANTLTAVDSAGAVGWYTSITIGADGLPVISYYDATNYDLKVAHCGNAACTSATLIAVDSPGDVGQNTSITIGADGLPVISYHDGTNSDLKVAHCGNAACSSANTLITVDSPGLMGYDTSITIGADGLPVISYYDYSNSDLKVLHCGNAACSSANTISTVDSAGDVGRETSITIGADGLPVISYQDYSNSDLKVLHCGTVACSSANTISTVDSNGDVGYYTSITIGTDGLPVISYYHAASGNLKVVHCSNAFCTPYFRRR